VRRLLKRMLKLGLLAGIAYAVWQYLQRRRDGEGVAWEAQPFPYPPQPRTQPAGASDASGAATRASDTAWVEPTGDSCPSTHPVKAKLTSKIFHVAGGANYDRTKPDRCYRDPASAEADGLRRAAR
jgi:hypothetical protein